MDKINIKNLEVYAYHGVFPEEKRNGQVFVISATLFAHLRAAGKTDNLKKTLDYGEICHQMKAFVIGNKFDLIETVAERLAEKLLVEHPLVKKIWIEIKKPNVPIPLSLETVSVEIERGWHTVYDGLGSNLGDRAEHIRFAVSELGKVRGCKNITVSSLISTPPYGYVEQGDFLNGCMRMETLLQPHELLDCLLGIENDAGRIRDVRWGPRTLDMDIIMYDDLIIRDNKLTIPHVEMHKRDFVLIPLCQLAPDLIHPIYKKTVAEMLSELETKDKKTGDNNGN